MPLKIQGAIVMSLRNRFKERRHIQTVRKSSQPSTAAPRSCPCQKPAKRAIDPPVVPSGEDETSFLRHQRVLAAEFQKAHPSEQIIRELMQLTFPMRRKDILEDGHVFDPLEKFPYLGNTRNVSFCFTLYGMHVAHTVKLAYSM